MAALNLNCHPLEEFIAIAISTGHPITLRDNKSLEPNGASITLTLQPRFNNHQCQWTLNPERIENLNQDITIEDANSSNSNTTILKSTTIEHTIKANATQDISSNISKTQNHTSEAIVSKTNMIRFSSTQESPWTFDVPEPGISEFPYLTPAIKDFIIYDPEPSIKDTINKDSSSTNSTTQNISLEYTTIKHDFTTLNTTKTNYVKGPTISTIKTQDSEFDDTTMSNFSNIDTSSMQEYTNPISVTSESIILDSSMESFTTTESTTHETEILATRIKGPKIIQSKFHVPLNIKNRSMESFSNSMLPSNFTSDDIFTAKSTILEFEIPTTKTQTFINTEPITSNNKMPGTTILESEDINTKLKNPSNTNAMNLKATNILPKSATGRINNSLDIEETIMTPKSIIQDISKPNTNLKPYIADNSDMEPRFEESSNYESISTKSNEPLNIEDDTIKPFSSNSLASDTRNLDNTTTSLISDNLNHKMLTLTTQIFIITDPITPESSNPETMIPQSIIPYSTISEIVATEISTANTPNPLPLISGYSSIEQLHLDEIPPDSSEIETLESGVSISTSLDFGSMNPLIIKDQEPGYRTFQSKFQNQESTTATLRTPEHSYNHTVPKVQYPIASNTTSLADDIVTILTILKEMTTPKFITPSSKFQDPESTTAGQRTPEHSPKVMVPTGTGQYPITSNTTPLADDIVTKSFPMLESSILTTTSPISTVHSNPTPMFVTPLSKFQDQESVTAELRTPEHSSKHMFPMDQHPITSNTNFLVDDIVTKRFSTLESSILTTTTPISTVQNNPTLNIKTIFSITTYTSFSDKETITSKFTTPKPSILTSETLDSSSYDNVAPTSTRILTATSITIGLNISKPYLRTQESTMSKSSLKVTSTQLPTDNATSKLTNIMSIGDSESLENKVFHIEIILGIIIPAIFGALFFLFVIVMSVLFCQFFCCRTSSATLKESVDVVDKPQKIIFMEESAKTTIFDCENGCFAEDN